MRKKQERGNSYSGIIVSDCGVRAYRKSFAKNRRYEFYNEYLCSRYLQALGPDMTPQVMAIDHVNQYIDYEICDSAEDDKKSSLDYLLLTKRIHSIDRYGQLLGMGLNASQPLLDIRDFMFMLGTRLTGLERISNEQGGLTLGLSSLIELYKKKYLELEEALLDVCLRSLPVFSHADSGVHNCVRGRSGALLMADLEYAGKDSPLKQAIDYLLHPKCQRCTDTHENWWNYFNEEIFDVADNSVKRLVASALSLKWAVIMLNEFRPKVWMLRVTADETRATKRPEIQRRQMEKSLIYYRKCDILEKSEVPYGLFNKSERDLLSESY